MNMFLGSIKFLKHIDIFSKFEWQRSCHNSLDFIKIEEYEKVFSFDMEEQ